MDGVWTRLARRRTADLTALCKPGGLDMGQEADRWSGWLDDLSECFRHRSLWLETPQITSPSQECDWGLYMLSVDMKQQV